jgi:RNA polymerase sigma-70 factor (ECF subfamily)
MAGRQGEAVSEHTDRELVALAKEGDEDAFASLVRRHSAGMHRVVARMLYDDEEAWDVVQMALLRAWQRLAQYDPRWSFATWAYRIATNLAIDVMRSRASRERTHQASALQLVSSEGRPPEAFDQVHQGEINRILGRLVEQLSPRQRAAFVLREMEGMETNEVAEMIGCSATTVRNHVFQARKILREQVAIHYPELVPVAKGGCHAV